MANTLAATLSALAPSSWWKLDEAANPLVDSGSGGFDLTQEGAGQAIFQMPGLAEGSPRVYGAWPGAAAAAGTVNNTGVTYDGIGWTTGGLGVFAMVGLRTAATYLIMHEFRGFQSWRMSIRVDPGGTIVAEVVADNANVIRLTSASGVFEYGKRNHVAFDQDGTTQRLYYNGVELAVTAFYNGAGIGATSWADAIYTNAGGGGPGSGIFVGNSPNTPVSTRQTGIMSMPFVNRNQSFSADDMAAIYAAAGYGNGHDDYLEYMLELVGNAKLYWPGLSHYAQTLPALVVNNSTTGSVARYQAGTTASIEVDTRITATAYDKKQWDMSGTDDDAYLDNAARSPFVEAAEAGLTGTISFLFTIQTVAVSEDMFNYNLGTSSIKVRVEPGVGTEGQLFWEVTIAGVVVFSAWTDNEYFVGESMLFQVVQDGTGYKFYINGSLDTSFTEITNTDDLKWFGDIFKGVGTNVIWRNIVDWAKTGHEFFYTDEVFTAEDVAGHWDATNGIFPNPNPTPPPGGFADSLAKTGNAGAGPDWWWRMNAAAGGIIDVGSAQNRPGPTPPPIQGNSIVTGGDPTFQVGGPLPADPSNAAIYLDGVGDYFEIGVNGAKGQLLDPSTGTVGFFFSLNALIADNIVFSIGNAAYTNFIQFGLNGKRVEVIVQRSAGNRVTLTSSIELTSDFAMVAVTNDGNFVLYIDGVPDAMAAVVETGTGVEGDWFDQVTGAQTAIGAKGDTAFTTVTTGRPSEVFLYDGEVLSADVIGTLYLLAIAEGLAGVPNAAGLVVFEDVEFRNGSFADIRAEETGGVFQQVVKASATKFLAGAQGSASYAPQTAILKGATQAEFRGCEFDLMDTPVFGRGGVVGSQINPALPAPQYGQVLVSDSSFNRMGYLNGPAFLSSVMALAGFGITVEGNRIRNSHGTAVGWLADAQNVAVINNIVKTVNSAVGAIAAAAGLNSQLGTGWLIRGNQMIDVDGTAMINLEGVTADGGNNYARNIAILKNEMDGNAGGALIRATQVADILIEGNRGRDCAEGIRLGAVESSAMVRTNILKEVTGTGIITAESALALVSLMIAGNRVNSAGGAITVSNVRDAAIMDNISDGGSLGIQIGDIGQRCYIAQNDIDATTPFALLAATTQVGLTLGRNALSSLGAENVRTVVDEEITAIAPHHAITIGAAGDLETVNGPTGEGFVMVLRRAPFSQDITCKDGVGNLQLAGDFAMLTDNSQLTLVRSGNDWNEVSRYTAI